MALFTVENLTFSYPGQTARAIDSLSLTVPEGAFLVLCGPSGCGKSTLLNILGLLDNPTSGSYTLLDHEVAGFREKDRTKFRKGNIGFVFQSFNLIDELNVFENVELPLIYMRVKASERKRRVNEILSRMNISHRAEHFPQQLSGGQQQRVAIARALMTNPELLLLDEITSALDPMLVGEVLDMVAELKEQGTTILMATHEMSFAHDAADRIVLLRHGVIAENGTPQQVMDESQDPETREFFSHFRN